MERLSYSYRCAVSVELADRLRERGSWCGETHLQKAMYIFQDISRLNFGYKFIIYKHGPYSFDFSSELSAMRAAQVLEFQFPQKGYGPNIVPTALGIKIHAIHSDYVEEFKLLIQFLADWFGNHDVKYLEKIATAYFVTRQNPRIPVEERARRLHSLKPHVDISAAEEAVRIVDDKRALAKERFGVRLEEVVAQG